MKLNRLAGACLFFVTLFLFSQPVNAGEIGFSAALLAQHSGKGEIFNGQETTAESAGIPLELFVVADDIRYAYRSYQQYAKDTYSSGSIRGNGTARFQTEVFSVSLVKQVEQTDQNLSLYGMAGLGLFQSVLTAEAYLSDGRSFTSQTTQRKTSGLLNPGFLLGAGMKKTTGNVFVGGEVNYLNATLTYAKVDTEDDVTLDASGVFISLIAGVVF